MSWNDDAAAYAEQHKIESIVEDLLSALLRAKPENPKQWLLDKMDKDLRDESENLSEPDLRKLFSSTHKILAELVPKDTIDVVISETRTIVNCDVVTCWVLDRKSDMLSLYASNLQAPIRCRSSSRGIAGYVISTLEIVNISNCYLDSRFDGSFDEQAGYTTRSLVAVPILDYENQCCGVLEAINKQPEGAQGAHDKTQREHMDAGQTAVPFEKSDEKLLWYLSQHVGVAMRNAELYGEAIASSERATGLLNAIQSLSHDLGAQSLLLTITIHANKIVNSQRSTVFIVDEVRQQLWSVCSDTGEDIRIPKRAGIVGQCACEGTVINIPDAYVDSRFVQEVDRHTGFKTQSILVVPIFDAITQKVDGVIQLVNKVLYDGQLGSFDDVDVSTMESFARIVGPKLTNCAMVTKWHPNSVAAQTLEADSAFRAELLLANTPKRASYTSSFSDLPEMPEFADED